MATNTMAMFDELLVMILIHLLYREVLLNHMLNRQRQLCYHHRSRQACPFGNLRLELETKYDFRDTTVLMKFTTENALRTHRTHQGS